MRTVDGRGPTRDGAHPSWRRKTWPPSLATNGTKTPSTPMTPSPDVDAIATTACGDSDPSKPSSLS